MLSVASVSVLRAKQPDLPRPYRMWGYPYTLGAFMLVSVWFVVNALVTTPGPSFMALGIIAAGIPMYCLWRKPAATQDAAVKGELES